MKREELLYSPVYWTSLIQDELYREIEKYMEKNHMNKAQLADHLGCTRGYVTQLLSGDFDHKLSKLVELSLAIGLAPKIIFQDINTVDESARPTVRTAFVINHSVDGYSHVRKENTARRKVSK